MAKTRNVACQFYANEGNCTKGREGTFWRKCQTCNLYAAVRGGKVAKPDTRREKKEKYEKDRRNWE